MYYYYNNILFQTTFSLLYKYYMMCILFVLFPGHNYYVVMWLQGEIWVGADNQEECAKWVKALKEAGTV